ncbi:MAG TPA: ankyrin repeat domain-containing protein [Kofleriaceae bacterium]|nr:ankyrin repeat domain-containing protein [Kofleriaceae bacterium]
MTRDIDEELRLAAEKGDLVQLREAIARGAQPNAWPSGTDSALCYAVMYDHPDAVKLLVDAGADVRHAGAYNRRPLHHAKRAEIATLLIDHGAELAILDDGGDDALRHQITRYDLDDVAAVLLDRGLALIRYTTAPPSVHEPRSHLQWAVFCKRPRVVRLLLARGCDPKEYSSYGRAVIFEAFSSTAGDGNEIARILIEAGARVDERLLPQLCDRRAPALVAVALAHGGQVNSSALQEAARVGDLEVLTMLLEHPSAHVDAADLGGTTALMAAAAAGRGAAVELLLRCGATPTIRDRDGETALHHAAERGDLGVFLQLVKAGCRIDEETEHGWTTLHHVARSTWSANSARIAEIVLEAGIAVDHRVRDGKTPLMIAASAGSVFVHEVLVQHGADRSLRDADGKTEADYAREHAAREQEERERAERFY